MFKKACSIAQQFTAPVVLSRRTVGGKCSSAIGSYVIVNEDGWFVTADHILEFYTEMIAESLLVKTTLEQIEEIEKRTDLDRKSKRKELTKITKVKQDQTKNCSAWFGRNGLKLKTFGGIKAIDLGFGQFEDFDPSLFSGYPTFKDPDKDFLSGVSLCKLGFPFHKIEPTWKDEMQKFELPAGSVPLPLFPIEGILTRTVNILVPGDPPPHPLELVETSSPGLKGQSGGPTFDSQGTVWAIQSKTASYPLGFNPCVPGTNNKEHQFLNVALGVHTSSIIGLFREQNIDIQVSAY